MWSDLSLTRLPLRFLRPARPDATVRANTTTARNPATAGALQPNLTRDEAVAALISAKHNLCLFEHFASSFRKT